jgi:hypothetical protein
MCGVCRMQRTHAVCFGCRYAVKRWDYALGSCPFCRTDLRDAGVKFRTPRKVDDRGWRRAAECMAELEAFRAAAARRRLGQYGF